MKRKIIATVITIAMILTGLPMVEVSAEVYSGNGWSFNSTTGTLTVTTNSGTTAWRNDVGLADITAVIFQGDITRIGSSAFRDCTNLTSITIPDSVTSIDGGTFGYCSNLVEVIFESETPPLFNDGNGHFWRTPYNLTIYVPIGSRDIYETVHVLSELYIVEVCNDGKCGVCDVCEPVWNYDLASKTLTISEARGLEAWRYYSKENNKPISPFSDVTTVIIQSGVTSIVGSNTFYNFKNLTSITIPDSVTSISGSAFDSTAWFDNQQDGVVYAGKVAYTYKGNMVKTLVLRDDTVGIASSAFCRQRELVSVTIPDSVTNIGSYAFGDCRSLTSATFKSIVPPNFEVTQSIKGGASAAFTDCENFTTIYVPIGSKAAYEAVECLREYDIVEYDYNSPPCITCGKLNCTILHTDEPEFLLGRIRNNDTDIGIGDALQVLMYLAKIPTSLLLTDTTGRAMKAALIANPNATEPTISDVLQILMYLAKIKTSILWKFYA